MKKLIGVLALIVLVSIFSHKAHAENPISLPQATLGASYDTYNSGQSIGPVSGSRYTLAVTAGSFPPGLSLTNTTGRCGIVNCYVTLPIEGVPTRVGDYNFGITLTSGTQQIFKEYFIRVSSTTGYVFTRDLTVGSQGEDVGKLQEFLISKGFMTSAITNYFGDLT